MKTLHIDVNTKNVGMLDKYINSGKDVFVLFYMEGCGPCNATRPEWSKIKNVLSHKSKNNNTYNNIVVADIDQELSGQVKNLKSSLKGFPTIKYFNKKNNIEEDYEDSSIREKNRSVDSFIEWINSKTNVSANMMSGGKSRRRRIKKTLKISGGKWSLKYKKSINCKKPKGFSQRQHCKYGRK